MDQAVENQLGWAGGGALVALEGASWFRSSPSQLGFARQAKSFKRARTQLETAKAKALAQEATLRTAVSCIPGAANLLGIASQLMEVGRLKNPKPGNFIFVCRALMCLGITQLQLGVKRTRLLLAAQLVLLRRQASGLTILLKNSFANRIAHQDRNKLSVDMAYAHEWGETDSTFESFGNGRLIAGRMGVHVQTIQQTGQVAVTIDSGVLDRTRHWKEEWLCQPLVVEGTEASDMLPALLKVLPVEFLLTGPIDVLKATPASVDSFVFAPCCDAASGNISILKYFWKLAERLRAVVGPRLLYLRDTCQVHSHQRGKASIRTSSTICLVTFRRRSFFVVSRSSTPSGDAPASLQEA